MLLYMISDRASHFLPVTSPNVHILVKCSKVITE